MALLEKQAVRTIHSFLVIAGFRSPPALVDFNTNSFFVKGYLSEKKSLFQGSSIV